MEELVIFAIMQWLIAYIVQVVQFALNAQIVKIITNKILAHFLLLIIFYL